MTNYAVKSSVEKHTHTQCQHSDLAYCAHCDLVYCKECGREWPTEKIVYRYPSYTYPVIDWPKDYDPPWTVTYTWGNSSDSAGQFHTH